MTPSAPKHSLVARAPKLFSRWNQGNLHTTMAPIETQLLINNKLVPASDQGTFDLFSPHTGDLVAKGTILASIPPGTGASKGRVAD